MKALVYTNPNQVTFRDEPDPIADKDECVLRIEAVGICGSDMHAFHGHDPRRVPPLVLGHEIAGEVVAGPRLGERVTVNPLITCGTCEFCVQGRDNLCANRTMVGMTRPGGFAELMSIPARCLIPVPREMTPVQTALTEPAATVLHGVNAAARTAHRPLAEGKALVLGGGAIGLLAALLLRARGVREVWLAETNGLRRETAAASGACRPFDPHDSGNCGPAAASVDLVVDAVGVSATRATALAAAKPGGVVLHIGLQDWASELDWRRLTLAEITLLGVYTYTTADLRATVSALHHGDFGDLRWVEQRPLSEGAAAFRDLDQGRTAAAKIVLTAT